MSDEQTQASGLMPAMPGGESLAERAVAGVVWTYAGFAAAKLLALASTMILVRLLLPKEFGQMGFALLLVGYLDTLGDFGVGSALIYQRKRVEEAANIAFVVNLATGALWWLAATALAPFAATFFREPVVEPLMQTLAWVFPITAVGNTHDALLRRNLSFKQRLIPDCARALFRGGVAVLLAWFGWGVWSLVWGHLLGAAASTATLWALMPWRPRLVLPADLVRGMIRFGTQIVSNNVLVALAHHVDGVIVGYLLGSAALGYYTLAGRIPEVFITMLLWSVSRVAFPAYSTLREDPAMLRRAFLTTLRYLSLVTLPAGVGMTAAAALLIPALYGDKWTPAVPVLQAMALTACFRSLGSQAGEVYKAIGRPDILTKLGLARLLVLIPVLAWGTQWGIAGVAFAQMGVTAAGVLATPLIMSRVFALPLRAYASELKLSLLASAGMLPALWTLLPVVDDWSPALGLLPIVGAGIAAYLLSLWWLSRSTVEQVGTVLAAALGRRRVNAREAPS